MLQSLHAPGKTAMNRILVSALGLCAAGFLFAGTATAQQKVYQWKDAQGRMHYSSSPPPSGKFTVRGAVASAPATATPAKSAAPENTQCKQARSNLTVLKGNSNVQIDSDGDGKPDRLLSADEHANQVKLAESTIAVSCAPAKP